MVDFEDRDVAQAGQAVRARVEPRPENDELLDVGPERGRDHIVDESGARHDGRTHAGPPVVDESRHELAKSRNAGPHVAMM